MARLSALMTLSLCGVLLAPLAGLAQSQSEPENRCFPWQELRDGTCVAKAVPVETAPGQSRQLTTTPRDEPPAAAAPVAPPPAPPVVIAPPPPPLAAPVAAAPAAAPAVAILCDGGTVTGNACSCPGGYTLLPASSGSGGTCVRSNA